MLQSIQYVGSGPPTYVYSKKAVGASGEYYHVFATETRGYHGNRERQDEKRNSFEKELVKESAELEEFKVLDNIQQDLQEVYLKEYGRRESFLWKLK